MTIQQIKNQMKREGYRKINKYYLFNYIDHNFEGIRTYFFNKYKIKIFMNLKDYTDKISIKEIENYLKNQNEEHK